MPFFLELGLFIAIITIASRYATYKWGDSSDTKMKIRRLSKAEKTQNSKERAEARKAYEELVKEKLDVMKTAITMGYSERELDKLDLRLEKLIGKEKLEKVVSGDTPLADADLLDTDLESELRRMKEGSK